MTVLFTILIITGFLVLVPLLMMIAGAFESDTPKPRKPSPYPTCGKLTTARVGDGTLLIVSGMGFCPTCGSELY